VEGDATALPFDDGYFDLSGTRRTLHHIRRPELVLAELTRVTAPGGRILVEDQIAPADPLAALELDRFERARDPSHARTLADADIRGLFDVNGLVLERSERAIQRRELGPYLELAASARRTSSVTLDWASWSRSARSVTVDCSRPSGAPLIISRSR